MTVQPGWYLDPEDPTCERLWDGLKFLPGRRVADSETPEFPSEQLGDSFSTAAFPGGEYQAVPAVGLARRLSDEQLSNTRQLQRYADWLLRLSTPVFILGIASGVALLLQEQNNRHPYIGTGLVIMLSCTISALAMALAGQWAKTYATAQLILVTQVLTERAAPGP